MKRPANVVHVDQVAWKEMTHGASFGWRRRSLGQASGARLIGTSLYEIEPGRKSFPFHYHTANEEAIFVLEGSGTLRLADGEVAIGAGDYVALPPGESGAHQVINTSNATLRYLCMSTMIEPEVSVYPDAGKVGFFVGMAPGGPPDQRTLEGFVPLASRVDYWDGEE